MKLAWQFSYAVFIITMVMVANVPYPKVLGAQDIGHSEACTSLVNQQTSALKSEQWEHLISAAREYLSNCKDGMDARSEADALDMIMIGLNEQGRYEDALPLSRRCLSVKPDAAYCFTDMGMSYEGLGQLQDARQSYRNAIAIGGYDVVNAAAIELAKKRLAALDLRDDGAENLRAENPRPSSEPSPAEPQACSKVVSFGVLVRTPQGIRLLKGEPSWLKNWVRKNATKYPDICFSQSPMQRRANYLVVLSDSPHYFHGFEPVVRTNTTTTPVSGDGTVIDNYGDIWNYTIDGTVTTTTTTHENVPYEINSNTLYADAYDDHGALVSQSYHVYSTKSGGDDAGVYNMGNAFRGINARGRLINRIVKDIEGPVTKK